MDDPNEQDIARVLYEVEIATCSIPNEERMSEYWERENQRLYRKCEATECFAKQLALATDTLIDRLEKGRDREARLRAELHRVTKKMEERIQGWQFCTSIAVVVAIIEAIVRLR